MMRSLNTAATGMVSQQFNMDVIANNLANVNTTGFKHQKAEFQDVMYQTLRASGANNGGSFQLPEPLQIGLGSRFAGSSSSFASGPLLSTTNPLDIAVIGQGFFNVEKPDGTVGYSRDGSFRLDANGLIVTQDGYPLQPNITIPVGASAISVSPTGVVSAIPQGATQPQDFGQITISIFANPAGLSRAGQNLYTAGGSSGDPVTGNPGDAGAGLLQSEFLEGSNVQIVQEMVNMITAQRAYEINSKAITTSDDMLSTLIQLKR